MNEPVKPDQVSSNIRNAVVAATACVLFSSVPAAKASASADRPVPSDTTASVAQRIAQVRAKASHIRQSAAALPISGRPTLANLHWFGNWPNFFSNFPNWGKWDNWHHHHH